MVGEEDAQVLDGGDEIILDLLAPEPPPPGTLEVMVIGGIGKALLHELLAPLAIASGPCSHNSAPLPPAQT